MTLHAVRKIYFDMTVMVHDALRPWTVTVIMMLLAVGLQGCFTGVESTPKVTSRDVRRNNVKDSPEKLFMAEVPGREAPSRWRHGKEFIITDPRIGLIFEPSAVQTSPLAGDTLRLLSVASYTSLTGDSLMALVFDSRRGPVTYHTMADSRQWTVRDHFEIPFTIEKSMLDSVNALMAGNTYYILPQRRLSERGTDTIGMRYVPVEITAVTPGNANYPLMVNFVNTDGVTQHLMMTVGTSAASTRNFHTLFSFTDPRKQYPEISDQVWRLIQHSQVQLGMTPKECRLALGPPDDYLKLPSSAGIVERWVYNDGVYLIFEDGMLSRFRR